MGKKWSFGSYGDARVHRRGFLSVGTLVAAFSALGAGSAQAGPGDKTPPGSYVPIAEKGVASGVATLDTESKIPPAQLPDLSTTYGRKTHVTVGSGGDYPTLKAALDAHPAGCVDIELVVGVHQHAATYVPTAAQKNVTIRGQGREATQVICTAGFIDAPSNADGWTISTLRVSHTAGTNTHDGIKVEYPRRWSVNRCRVDGFGGSSIRFRGGIQCEIENNYIIAEDSTNTNGFAGIHIERSTSLAAATVLRTRGNYVGAGVQYGIFVAYSNVGCTFEGDTAELCAVGMRFEVSSGELRSPYTEANKVGLEFFDSNILLTGRVRDEPVVTWTNIAAANRVITRVDRYYINAGKGLIHGGPSGSSNFATAPSFRWGSGSPVGIVAAPVGSIWMQTNGTAGATMWVKESGTDAGGWVAK